MAVRAEGGNGSSGQYDYDMITIGAGSGGVRASRFATSYGELLCSSCARAGSAAWLLQLCTRPVTLL